MKRRMLSLLLALCLALALLPGAAMAADGTITVTFTLIGDSVHAENAHAAYQTWIDASTLTVSADATAGDAFTQALEQAGYTAVGADVGYVSAITTPDGVTLAAMGNGANSGWMFRVNGEMPSVGMNDCALSDGDAIEWFFVDDWNTLFSADAGFTDIAELPQKDAIVWAVGSSLFSGVTASQFAPERAITRGQLVTVLYRLAGTPAAGESSFSDIADGAWCETATAWAAESGVALGYADGSFAPDRAVTRQQFAAMLYRYARLAGLDTTQGGMAIREFSDYDAISGYALQAMTWCVNAGLLTGTDGSIAPTAAITRAEVAAALYALCA